MAKRAIRQVVAGVVMAAVRSVCGATDGLPQEFTNPIAEGADPWVVRYQGSYYWCQSEGNAGVAIWRSDRLTDLGEKHVVWRAPKTGPHRAQIWAPELHHLDGRWYIYTTASDGNNANHRSVVLESESDDPLSKFHLKAELYTGDFPETGEANRWSIDTTVLEHGGKRYAIWSGWEDENDVQHLYIAPLVNPWTIGGRRVRLCANDDYLWERVGETLEGRGLHEAPQVLKRDGRVFVVYSCSGSWEPSYKLGMLELRPGGDPLDPSAWSKRSEPVFLPTDETCGVGHCCFTQSPDGTEDWLVYHAKRDRAPGWRRAICIQPFTWNDRGEPVFGKPLPWGKPVEAPSGQSGKPVTGALTETFERGIPQYAYYGHHQFFKVDDGRLHLGSSPSSESNGYRCGEKLVVRDGAWDDFSARVRVCVLDGEQDAGLLFRTTDCSLGYDAQRGYFAGIIPAENRIILGATDGRRWEELARCTYSLELGKAYVLQVDASGDRIAVSVDGEELLSHHDGRYRRGTIGLRVVNSHAWFDDLTVQPAKQRTKGK